MVLKIDAIYSCTQNVCCNVDQEYNLLILCTHSPTSSRSSLNSKAAGEEVPMDASPAYGVVKIYDTVGDQKEN